MNQPHLAGVLALVGTALLASLLTRAQLLLSWDEHAPWWSSNGRDVLNGFSVMALTTAMSSLGIHWDLAVVLAAHLVALSALAEWALHRTGLAGADAIAIGASVLAATPVALFPGSASLMAARVLAALTP